MWCYWKDLPTSLHFMGLFLEFTFGLYYFIDLIFFIHSYVCVFSYIIYVILQRSIHNLVIALVLVCSSYPPNIWSQVDHTWFLYTVKWVTGWFFSVGLQLRDMEEVWCFVCSFGAGSRVCDLYRMTEKAYHSTMQSPLFYIQSGVTLQQVKTELL